MRSSQQEISYRRQLRAEMSRYGINPVSAFDRLFVQPAPVALLARTLTFAPVPIPRVRTLRRGA